MQRRTLGALTASIVVLGAYAMENAAQIPADLPAAELVVWGGRIVTVDPSQPEVEALAAQGGRIVAIGPRREIARRVGPKTRVVDLKGALAVPGLIEAHAHFLGLGDSRIQLDLRQAQSWNEIVELVRQAAAKAAPGQWIRGRGWHQDKWQSRPARLVGGFPVHDELSAAAPDHPVMLTHASGHALIANAKAMAAAGIVASTVDPPGGDLVRDAEGRPTGLFNETAQDLIEEARGSFGSPAEIRRMAELASEESLRKGITSFQDAGTELPVLAELRQLAEQGAIQVRLWLMAAGDNAELAKGLPGAIVRGAANDHFTIGGIKRYMDGALGSRGAWLLAPYSDDASTSGLVLAELDDLRETARIAAANELQLCIHAIGDRANRQVLDLYAESYGRFPAARELRWRIEHAQHLDPADIRRFGQLGVVASIQAVHCTSDGPWVPDRLGAQRAKDGAYPWRALLDSGAVVVNGTDAPVEDIDPIANFHAAVTRQMANGQAFYPEQRMRREEALKAATLDAAWAAREEQLKGSLTVGKLADLTVLSKDILRVPDEEIRSAVVLYTIVGGKVVYQKTP